jgi:hypothetical protein
MPRFAVFAYNQNPETDSTHVFTSGTTARFHLDNAAAEEVESPRYSRAIRMHAAERVVDKHLERRGSPEASNCLTASESELNAGCRYILADAELEAHLRLLAMRYESLLEKHEAKGLKGTPIACAEIAAKVKTLLFDPTLRKSYPEGRFPWLRDVLRVQTQSGQDRRSAAPSSAIADNLQPVFAGD